MFMITASPVLEHRQFGAPETGVLCLIRRHPVAALLVLTFGLTWLLEIPRVLDARGELPFAFPFWAVILMGWMPGVAAIIVASPRVVRAAVDPVRQGPHLARRLAVVPAGHWRDCRDLAERGPAEPALRRVWICRCRSSRWIC